MTCTAVVTEEEEEVEQRKERGVVRPRDVSDRHNCKKAGHKIMSSSAATFILQAEEVEDRQCLKVSQ